MHLVYFINWFAIVQRNKMLTLLTGLIVAGMIILILGSDPDERSSAGTVKRAETGLTFLRNEVRQTLIQYSTVIFSTQLKPK